MNIHKELKALLLSENEEDCRLGFEIAKRKGIKAKTIDMLENGLLLYNKKSERFEIIRNYYKLPISTIAEEFLESRDRYTNKKNAHYEYYEWKENV